MTRDELDALTTHLAHRDALDALLQRDDAVWGWDAATKQHMPCLCCNDYFVPGADAEPFLLADAPRLLALSKAAGAQRSILMQWIADRRGVPNVHWRTALRSRG